VYTLGGRGMCGLGTPNEMSDLMMCVCSALLFFIIVSFK
jgi:hypothetical protein